MVLREVAHRWLLATDGITHTREVRRVACALAEGDEEVIDADLVIEVVEACLQVLAVAVGLVDLRKEERLGILLTHRGDRPRPEGGRYKLGHITAEAIDTTCSPVAEDITHLHPRVGDGVGMQATSPAVVHPVVELHRLVPVVDAGVGAEAVVARSACWALGVWG